MALKYQENPKYMEKLKSQGRHQAWASHQMEWKEPKVSSINILQVKQVAFYLTNKS